MTATRSHDIFSQEDIHAPQYTSPIPVIDERVEIVLPPQDTLNALYERARDGDMDAIITYLDTLVTQDTAFEAFCRQLRELASGYRDEHIIRLLRRYIGSREEPV